MKDDFNLEETMNELDEIIKGLEDDTQSLNEAFDQYKKGLDLLKLCNESIDKVEKELIILEEN